MQTLTVTSAKRRKSAADKVFGLNFNKIKKQPSGCFFVEKALEHTEINLREYRTEIVRQMRSQIFCQIVQIECRHTGAPRGYSLRAFYT